MFRAEGDSRSSTNSKPIFVLIYFVIKTTFDWRFLVQSNAGCVKHGFVDFFVKPSVDGADHFENV